jgi:hypothetical protein
VESQQVEDEAAISQDWARVYREAKQRKRAAGAPHGRTNRMLRQARRRRAWLFVGALAGTALLFALCLAMLK